MQTRVPILPWMMNVEKSRMKEATNELVSLIHVFEGEEMPIEEICAVCRGGNC